ncbi:hypothetical protein LA345_23385 [Burkholderia vietnamiensis]|nr:hypothetical protein [Burkholderia vietnamiensis]
MLEIERETQIDERDDNWDHVLKAKNQEIDKLSKNLMEKNIEEAREEGYVQGFKRACISFLIIVVVAYGINLYREHQEISQAKDLISTVMKGAKDKATIKATINGEEVK